MSGRDAAILEHLGVAGGQLAEQRRAQAFVDGVRWVPLDHQVPPAWDWDTWLIVAGRGAGKTKTGAEMALEELEELGPDARIGIGAPTKADVRDYCAEGPSGLITIARHRFRKYNRSLHEAYHVKGGYVKFLGTEDPDRWRGPEWTMIWFDELASCQEEAWDNALLGLRMGPHPRAIATTTPRPRKFLKELMKDETTAVTRASTFDNPYLSERAKARFIRRYEGTRLGRQELYAEFIEAIEGALWHPAWIDDHRVKEAPMVEVTRNDTAHLEPHFVRVVVAVDPAGTHNPKSDSTGIAVAGLGMDGEFYVLRVDPYKLSPDGWARQVLRAYKDDGADIIVAERNHGGEMVESTIRHTDPNANVKSIHASRGKAVRAEPVAALYEQGKVHHVGYFGEAEEQMCAFPVANENDDLVDALVYVITELSEGSGWEIYT